MPRPSGARSARDHTRVSQLMRAACYNRTGPAAEVLSLIELDVPCPGPGEVLVRLSCSGINPSDVKQRAGWTSSDMPFTYIIPHSDGAGTIVAVGQSVRAHRIGERVWLFDAQFGRRDGTAAEYVALPARNAVPLPAGVGFAEAACFGIPLRTAYRAIAAAREIAGRWVLVAGGAGAVGNYAVQLARRRGARVIATVSSGWKAELAHRAGAELTINYRQDDVVQAVANITCGRGVDHVAEVDITANARLLPAIVCRGGSVAVYGSSQPTATIPAVDLRVRDISVHFFRIYDTPPEANRRMIANLSAWLETGEAFHNVAARFPLDGIASAHQAVEQGQAGNIVLDL